MAKIVKTKKTRTRRVPATTNNLTRGIIAFLKSRGHFAFRVNNGAVYDPVRHHFRRRSKNDPAIADIHCTLNPSGVSLWIEVKNANTGDTPKSKQKEFAKKVTACGGMHYFAKSYGDFRRWYDLQVYDDVPNPITEP